MTTWVQFVGGKRDQQFAAPREIGRTKNVQNSARFRTTLGLTANIFGVDHISKIEEKNK